MSEAEAPNNVESPASGTETDQPADDRIIFLCMFGPPLVVAACLIAIEILGWRDWIQGYETEQPAPAATATTPALEETGPRVALPPEEPGSQTPAGPAEAIEK